MGKFRILSLNFKEIRSLRAFAKCEVHVTPSIIKQLYWKTVCAQLLYTNEEKEQKGHRVYNKRARSHLVYNNIFLNDCFYAFFACVHNKILHGLKRIKCTIWGAQWNCTSFVSNIVHNPRCTTFHLFLYNFHRCVQ